MSEAKVHPPTLRKLQKARAEGDLPKYKDVNALFVLTIGVIAAIVSIRFLFSVIFHLMENLGAYDNFPWKALRIMVLVLIPQLALVLCVEGFKRNWKVVFKMPTFSLTRINPVTNLKHTLGFGSHPESTNLVIKLVKYLSFNLLFGSLCLIITCFTLPYLLSSDPLHWGDMINRLKTAILCLSAGVCPALLIVSYLDYRLASINWKNRLRMTEQDYRREIKDQAGNPEVKKERSKLAQLNHSRSLEQAVRQAKIVVTGRV
jgi:flagellar biosynthetic protein FlhB